MDLPGFLLNAGGVVLGAGISWGYLKSEVKNLKREICEEKATIRLQEDKISSLKDRGMQLVFKSDCASLQDECQSRICAQFEDVKSEIRENRDAAAKIGKDMAQFMGYATAVLEELRKR